MAIFNENYMDELYENESINEEYEENNILDELLEACSNMLDVLDEGARQKYVKMQEEKAKDPESASDKYARKASKYTYGDADRGTHYETKFRHKNKDGSHISDNEVSIHQAANINKAKKISSNSEKMKDNYYRDIVDDFHKEYKYQKAGKAAFKKDFGGPGGEDKLASKKPGSVLAKQEEKKKAIKETCEYILSIIDDIE